MSTNPESENPTPPTESATTPHVPVRLPGRRNNDLLGLTWLHGSLHATVFRRQAPTGSWKSSTPVQTIEEFEVALDTSLTELGFAGTDVFLILAHDQFVHQAEQAPAFSEAASRNYLRGRVERYEKDHEPVLWVSQRTVSARQEAAFLLHMLPSAFYGRINRLLLSRRLDLTRILPPTVPLQFLVETIVEKKDQPVLLAAETGAATTVMVLRADGQVLFARAMLARWSDDPARVGVEVNRSLLYAKQQFGTVVDHIWLLGASAEAASGEVQARCGAGKQIGVRATTEQDWMQVVARLSHRHPINLVAGYLGRKRQQQFARRLLIAACWLGLGLMGLNTWSRSVEWKQEQQHLHDLQANEALLTTDRDRFQQRNVDMERRREFIRQVSDDRLPAVTTRFLAYLGGALPADAQLTDYTAKCDPATGEWTFRLDGQMEGDEETVREALASFQRQMAKGPLRARFNDAARSVVAVPAAGSAVSSMQRFSLEGGLFENQTR